MRPWIALTRSLPTCASFPPPAYRRKERCALLDKAFAEAHPYLVNFLKLLCEENLLAELPGCVRAYRNRYNADHGIIEVTVVSAVPLNDTSLRSCLPNCRR